MLRRAVLVLALLALLVSSCFAQDSGVKGSGVIATSNISVGTMDIKVALSGNVLSGGFRYAEYDTRLASIRPLAIIQSQRLTSLQVSGNYARVEAIGFWNGMLSDLVVETRDNGPGKDWFRIVARPRGPITILIIYDKAGDLIKGDLVVFGATAAPGFTNGIGAIKVGNNMGVFDFKARQTSTGAMGYASYQEVRPNVTGAIRPPTRIYIPVVQKLAIIGKTAVFAGKGTLNGMPAMVEIKVIDNWRPPQPANIMPTIPDEYYITAVPLMTDSTAAGYSAGGALIKGDIVVAAPK